MDEHEEGRIRAFFQEFSFLEELVDVRDVLSVKVQRVDMELIRFREQDDTNVADIYFLAENGEVLGKVGYRWFKPNIGRKWWQIMTSRWLLPDVGCTGPRPTDWVLMRAWTVGNETVGNALSSLSDYDKKRIRYVCVLAHFGYVRNLTIYKHPKQFASIDEYIRHLEKTAREKVRQEIAAVDVE